MENHQQLYCFAHIPKTAGTSLNALLRGYFGARGLSAQYRPDAAQWEYRERDLTKDLKYFPHVRFLSGHAMKPFVNFGKYENNIRWFTFLRNPAKRFLSLYVHQQTGGLPEYKMDLIDWSARFDRKNGMVQMIAGEQNIDRAIDVLEEKFSFVGITEEYELSIKLMKQCMSFDSMCLGVDEVKMQSRSHDIVSKIESDYEKYRECIEQNNELDMQLYEYARENIWPRQIEQQAGTLHPQASVIPEYRARINQILFNLQDKLLYRQLIRFGIL